MSTKFLSDIQVNTSSTYHTLITEAQKIVLNEGLARLSLRHLADQAEVSTATVTHHLGAKDSLVPHLILLALEADKALFTPFRQLSAQLPTPSAHLVAQAYASWFNEALPRMVLLSEILQQARPLPPKTALALKAWMDLHEEVWGELAGRTRARVIRSMLIDEAQ